MTTPALSGKTILITGAARRIGRALALACAGGGADMILHYRSSESEARQLVDEVARVGREAWILQADLANPAETVHLMEQASSIRPLYALVNNAAVFESLSLDDTTLAEWERHLAINLTAPFLLSQAFARQLPASAEGRIINLLDWRALRPGRDYFPYTISKAALASLTQSMARSLAPNITVNGLALGAILPPSHGKGSQPVIKSVPAARWGTLEDVENALLFLLSGSPYITGEIIHVDGGRHLV